MSDILTAQKAFSKLLDIEYEFILGRKNKQITLRIEFQKMHFFHIAGLQHLKDLPRLAYSADEIFSQLETGQISVSYIESSKNYDSIRERVNYLPELERIFDSNDTIFKYNPTLQAFSVIEADFLLKNEINRIPIFAFLSKNKDGKYFCKSFFPDIKKDYAERQTKWTVLFKKKISKSSGVESILYRHKNFETSTES
ncbi:MAG: PBECR4 domain-containing protein [Treponema sp.]|nr:PBECR4 domain-containing protein [Treponema sp.]